MTSLYYYDAFDYDYDYDFDYMDSTNLTNLYTFDRGVCVCFDIIIHLLLYVFLFMYAIGLLVLTFVVVSAPFWISLLMVLAIFSKWNDSKPSRHHSEREEYD